MPNNFYFVPNTLCQVKEKSLVFFWNKAMLYVKQKQKVWYSFLNPLSSIGKKFGILQGNFICQA